VRFVRADAARRFHIGQVEPYAQYDRSVLISFMPPRKRTWEAFQTKPDNLVYYTVRNKDGVVVYDSRQDVPCDMEAFAATRQRFAQDFRDRGYPMIEDEPALR
jgi:hypothetical protein